MAAGAARNNTDKDTEMYHHDEDVVRDESMYDPDDLWSTDDMSLAAFLKLERELLFTKWEGTSCYWFFLDNDELADAVADYYGGKAVADPRAHSSNVADLKREMFSRRGGRR